METIILELKKEARESWSGEQGENRAKRLEEFLRVMLKNYALVLGLSEEDILKKLEEKRNYSAINYYQEANFPKLESVEVFATIKELQDKFPSKKFICPCCGGISTDPNVCNSGKKKSDKNICDWKSFGLLGTLGKGYKFVVKEDFLNSPRVHNIFMPIECVKTNKRNRKVFKQGEVK